MSFFLLLLSLPPFPGEANSIELRGNSIALIREKGFGGAARGIHPSRARRLCKAREMMRRLPHRKLEQFLSDHAAYLLW